MRPEASTREVLQEVDSFWIFDDRLVVIEDWHAELWLDDADTIALYSRAWETFDEAAAYGTDAQRVISRARQAL